MLRPSIPQRLCALLVAFMGIVNVLSALLVRDIARTALLRALLPLTISHASRTATLIAGFALVLVAYGLWRGKRTAWVTTIGLLGISVGVHLLKGLDWEEAGIAAGLMALLWVQRRRFLRRSDIPTVRLAPLVLAGGIVGITAYALLGFWALQAFQPWSLAMALQTLGAQVLWLDSPYAASIHGHAAWFLDSISVLSLCLVVLALGMLLRPALPRRPSAEDRQKLDDLLRRFGTSSLAPLARMSDKQIYLGEQVEGAVAYALSGRVAVVCGDPIAAPGDVGVLAQEFVSFCRQQDWQVCFYEVQPRHLPDYAPLGFDMVKIGEDAWINLPCFTLQGTPTRDLRHAVSKVTRDGSQLVVIDPQRDRRWWEAMQDAEAAWRAQQRGFLLRFSIGQLPRSPEAGARYIAVIDREGQALLAYCSLLPIPGISGYALDVMRRTPPCPNGTMEFLLAGVLGMLRDEGVAWCSLGLAPLANVDPDDSSMPSRAVRALYQHPSINAHYHYQSLFFFKRKFQPEWRGGYLLYPGPLALPTVLAAVLAVHLPPLSLGQFLRAPRRIPAAGRASMQWARLARTLVAKSK